METSTACTMHRAACTLAVVSHAASALPNEALISSGLATMGFDITGVT